MIGIIVNVNVPEGEAAPDAQEIAAAVEGAFADPSQLDLQVHVMAAVGSVLPNLDPDATT